MTAIIFLDVDGVLNSKEYFVHKYNGIAIECVNFDAAQIDPDAVTRLNRIVSSTGAVVVLSSSWRLAHTIDIMREILASHGFVGTVVGYTPDIATAPRGDEIQAYLDAMPEPPESLVIIDDCADMGLLLPHLVQTSTEVGLTDADADRAIAMLKGRT